jgi:hypothetical protein
LALSALHGCKNSPPTIYYILGIEDSFGTLVGLILKCFQKRFALYIESPEELMCSWCNPLCRHEQRLPQVGGKCRNLLSGREANVKNIIGAEDKNVRRVRGIVYCREPCA